MGAAPGDLVARGSREPREAGNRRLGAAALRLEAAALRSSRPGKLARKAGVPCVCSPEPESTPSFHELYLGPSAAPTC